MAQTLPWSCPYCNRDTTLTESNLSSSSHYFNCNNKDDDLILETHVFVCPNPICKEYMIVANLRKRQWDTARDHWIEDIQPLLHWNLKPQSQAKVFPSYIPKPIIDDYEEACLIRDLSPKASATLSRRCLQGIIRDFHGIVESRLIDEINELEGKIDALIWQAIDAVRHIGNIGAHMEKDINLIIDVDPQEASALIGLIEMLLKDWYIDRHEKEKQLKGIIGIAEDKKEIKNSEEGQE